MFNIYDPNLCYLIIKSEDKYFSPIDNNLRRESLLSVLYSKDFTVIPIDEYHNNKVVKSFMGFSPISDNDKFRQEVLEILEFMNIDEAYLKYSDDINPTKITKTGREIPQEFTLFESDTELPFFVHDGLYFSIKEKKRYFFPKTKNHIKNGMIVEYLHNQIWTSKEVQNVDEEYEKMFRLLMKYNKLRVVTQ